MGEGVDNLQGTKLDEKVPHTRGVGNEVADGRERILNHGIMRRLQGTHKSLQHSKIKKRFVLGNVADSQVGENEKNSTFKID